MRKVRNGRRDDEAAVPPASRVGGPLPAPPEEEQAGPGEIEARRQPGGATGSESEAGGPGETPAASAEDEPGGGLGLDSKDGESLLLYLETCLVDQRGLVTAVRMNAGDMKLAREWDAAGFIKFGRLKMAELKAYKASLGTSSRYTPDHFVRFSTRAWFWAWKLRRERSRRMTAVYEERFGVPEGLKVEDPPGWLSP